MDFDESYWKLFLQASRSFLNRPGRPPKIHENQKIKVIIFELTPRAPENDRFRGFLKPPGHFQPVLAMKFCAESEFRGQEPPRTHEIVKIDVIFFY